MRDGADRPAVVDATADTLPAWRRTIRYQLTRAVLWFLIRCWFRLRVEHLDRLPPPPYVLVINHLSWLDPMILFAVWPASARIQMYGPKEADMSSGWRNRLIAWIGSAVPFDPDKTRLLTSAKRAVAVLKAGRILAIAGEGRLTEDEDVVLPLNEGAAFFAIRAGVPIVPVAINGTRWLAWGKVVRIRVGEPIPTVGLRADRATLGELTARLQHDLGRLVLGYPDRRVPGPVGRWLTEAFADRPWREAADAAEQPPEGDLVR
ncbi:MAG: lysophospholipid acyltransferase family protein [Candidatus Limnocylindrales bacterium]